MRARGSTGTRDALLRALGAALRERLEHDAATLEAWRQLQRLGTSVSARIELGRGAQSLQITLEPRAADVPEWSAADGELLRSLGIASEPVAERTRRAAKPRRRQPR
jgi:hypothetical protein